MFNLQSVQGPDPAQESSGGEEPIQVHALGVQAVPVQPVAEVVELGLGEGGGGPHDHLLPGGEVCAYIHPHSTQAQKDGHLDQALGEVFLQIQHVFTDTLLSCRGNVLAAVQRKVSNPVMVYTDSRTFLDMLGQVKNTKKYPLHLTPDVLWIEGEMIKLHN